MSKLHAPLFYAAADKYISTALTIAMTAIAARLLTPDQIGVFAIVSVIAVMSEALRDFGASVYIVQCSALSREAVRTAFTVMAAMSTVIALVLFLSAHSIAAFYSDARLIPAMFIAATGVLVASFAAPSMALLRREMRFGALAAINVSGLVANLISFLVFYALGWGYLSLVLAAFVAGATAAACAVLSIRKFWMFMPCIREWRDISAFCGFATATAILNTFYVALPQLLLGRLGGLDAAGLYNRATMLCQLPDKLVVGAFQPVIFPAFAAEVRTGGNLKSAYLRALTLLSAVQWPALLALALLAEPVVRVTLGPQWDSVAPALRIMALAWLFVMPSSLTYPVLVASGGIRDTMTSSLIGLPFSMLAIVLAAPFGIEALAWSMFFSLPLQMAIALIFIRRRIGFAWRELFGAVRQSAIVSILAISGPVGLVVVRGPSLESPVLTLLATAAVIAVGWLAGMMVTAHPLLAELRLVLEKTFMMIRRQVRYQ